MNNIIIYKYGFDILNRRYCWRDKKLYRMPFSSKLRWYGIKELKLIRNHSQKGYIISGAFYNFDKLKQLTKEVNHEIKEHIQTPF